MRTSAHDGEVLQSNAVTPRPPKPPPHTHLLCLSCAACTRARVAPPAASSVANHVRNPATSSTVAAMAALAVRAGRVTWATRRGGGERRHRVHACMYVCVTMCKVAHERARCACHNVQGAHGSERVEGGLLTVKTARGTPTDTQSQTRGSTPCTQKEGSTYRSNQCSSATARGRPSLSDNSTRRWWDKSEQAL